MQSRSSRVFLWQRRHRDTEILMISTRTRKKNSVPPCLHGENKTSGIWLVCGINTHPQSSVLELFQKFLLKEPNKIGPKIALIIYTWNRAGWMRCRFEDFCSQRTSAHLLTAKTGDCVCLMQCYEFVKINSFRKVGGSAWNWFFPANYRKEIGSVVYS